jgi:predicted esterase
MRRHPRVTSLFLVGLLAAAFGASCSDDGDGGANPEGPNVPPAETGPKSVTAAMFALPEADGTLANACSTVGGENEFTLDCTPGFFDHPFPSNARRDADGRARFLGYPNPYSVPLITSYIAYADRLEIGFSPEAAGWLRFSAGLDPATLPKDAAATREASSSVQLLDVDASSPEFGTRRLVQLDYRHEEGVYFAPDTLSFRPVDGFPLRPRTTYALVVTRSVKGLDGGVIQRPAVLDHVLGYGTPAEAEQKLRDDWAPALASIENAGIPRDQIAHLTVFTTNDPTAELFAAHDDALTQPAPTMSNVVYKDSPGGVDVYEGMYGPTPDYQVGQVPFALPEDGGNFDSSSGTPKVQRLYDQRFAIAVPDAAVCPVPDAGYPVVLYAHGTGGDYRSFIDDGTAQALAGQCLASMGVDQIFHGTRPGAPTGPNAETIIQTLFFNFENPKSARTNPRQSAIDETARARLFTNPDAPATISAEVAKNKQEIRFDGSKLAFFGHSQGGLNGPLFLAADGQTRGGVLSGSGSVITLTLLEKTSPTPSVAALVKSTLLRLRGDQQAEATVFHPGLALAQTIVDTTDPVHYVPRLIKNPRPGFLPKSIYQTEGVAASGKGDSYTPPRCIEAQAVATGLPLLNPVVYPFAGMDLAGMAPVDLGPAGLSGNLAGGQATGVLAQFTPQGGDGHFVVFNVPKARKQAALFCRGLADNPVGALVNLP